MQALRLWIRWSWRDLAARRLQVLAIALIIALGTGVYAGLRSSAPWQRASYDAGYAQLNMYDLRLTITRGSYIDGAALLRTIRSIPHAASITAVETRLLIPTLVDASTHNQTIMTPGRIVGVDVSDGGPHIDGIHITAGRPLMSSDSGGAVAVLEHHFAVHYGLPAAGTLRLPGAVPLRYVGTGLSPDYFMIITDEGGIMAQANFAVVFVPLATAQALAGHPGMVNDAVLTLAGHADAAVVRADLEQAMRAFPSIGVSYLTPAEDKVHSTLYGDIKSDQQFYSIIAYLFLAGAAFGTFNLANRMVEAQRRQIGISMALGVPPLLIAVRPLLVGLQIAVIGVICGVGVGLIVGDAYANVLRTMVPMPVFHNPFQADIFLQAAWLGIAIPFVATAYPVWRAVRVEPIAAIRTGYLVGKGGGGLAPLLAHIHFPGNSFALMPIRNLVRAPRRTLLTLLGIAVAIATLITVRGLLDSMLVTLDQARTEYLQPNPRRMTVDLDSFYPVGSSVLSTIEHSPDVAAAEPALRLEGYLVHDGVSIQTRLDLLKLDSTLWKPSVVRGTRPIGAFGLLISEKAARDLDVQPGQTVTLRYPRRDGQFAFRWVDAQAVVAGIHGGPVRFYTYMDLGQAPRLGLAGLVNMVEITPRAGVSQDSMKRALFSRPGVASVQPTSAGITVFEDLLRQFLDILSLVVVAVVALAFLITYNSTSINVDERAREIATMFAFGTPVRTVTRMAVVENLLIGVVGTLVGVGLGIAVLNRLVRTTMTTTFPDFGFIVALRPSTLVMAAVVGVGVVAITPVLSIRKLLRMKIPATLRVME